MSQEAKTTRDEELRHTLLCLAGKCGPIAAEAAEALRRLAEGLYGVCADCGETIPKARLRAAPEATRCISCQCEREELSAA